MTTSIGQHVKWTFLARFGAQVVQLVFSFFLARLITPSEFGAMNLILVIFNFGQVLCELGLGSALIYLGDPEGRLRDSIFWIIAAANLIFLSVAAATATLVTGYFSITDVRDVFYFVGASALVQAFAQLQTTVLSQRFDFRALGIATFTAAVLSSVTALAGALNGWGIWALAWQNLINQVVIAVICLWYTRWIPRPRFSVQDVEKALRYGLYLVGHNTLNFAMRNADNLIVGKALGSANLGLYNRAYSLMLLPLQNIGSIAGQVMFPTLSAMKNDETRFRETYLTSVRFISTISFPALAGLSILSREVLATVYGSQWVGAADSLSILSLVGLFQSIVFPVGWVYTSLGKTREQFRLSVVLLVLFLILIFAGLPWGIIGVSIGYAAWAVISGVWNVVICGRFMKLAPSAFFMALAPKLLITVGMAVAVIAVRWSLLDRLPSSLVVLGCMIAGAVVYIGIGLLVRDSEITGIIGRLTRRRSVQ